MNDEGRPRHVGPDNSAVLLLQMIVEDSPLLFIKANKVVRVRARHGLKKSGVEEKAISDVLRGVRPARNLIVEPRKDLTEIAYDGIISVGPHIVDGATRT